MNLARALFLASLLSCVLLLGYSFKHRVDAADHEHYEKVLLRLRSLETDVNEAVLSKKLNITRNFDPLAIMMRETGQVHAELGNVPSFLSESARQNVLTAIHESDDLQRGRKRNVERFEAEDAALAASVHILAPETTTLAARLESSGARALSDSLKTLRVEVLEVVASRELGHRALIDAAIASLRADSTSWPSPEDRALATLLISHVERILQHRTRVDQLTREIVTADGMEHALAIEQRYLEGFESARETWERCVRALLVLALVMLGAASAYVILRLRASATQLEATSSQLSSALALLREERTKERELAELKTRFVAMTSHEFRTPLSVINSSSELLESYGDKWDGQKRGEHFARIRRAVSGMTAMLDRILVIGKTDAGMLEFHPSVIALDRLLVEIASAIEMADGGKRPILVDVAEDVGSASADETLVRHVLENLLSNAVKYSPEGASVRFTATREGEDVRLVVKDSGIGIPEADKARLFDNFHRAKNALLIPGTGLGLSVAKHAAELHGGSIEFASVVGEGTTFTVVIRAVRGLARATRMSGVQASKLVIRTNGLGPPQRMSRVEPLPRPP